MAPGEAAKILSALSTCHCSSIDIASVSYQAMLLVNPKQAVHPDAWLSAYQTAVVHCRSPRHTCGNESLHSSQKALTMLVKFDNTSSPHKYQCKQSTLKAADVFSLVPSNIVDR